MCMIVRARVHVQLWQYRLAIHCMGSRYKSPAASACSLSNAMLLLLMWGLRQQKF
jgi:hypothetical protein